MSALTDDQYRILRAVFDELDLQTCEDVERGLCHQPSAAVVLGNFVTIVRRYDPVLGASLLAHRTLCAREGARA